MPTDAVLTAMLMYGVVPAWLVAGPADWLCHRRQRIEANSGVKESLLHILQFVEVGVPLLAALVLEIDAAVLLLMLLGLVLHQATVMWDISYADATRRIPPAEQHVHAVLEMVPLFALLLVAVVHRDQLLAPDFALRLKHPPLAGWYLAAVLAGAVLCGVIPYGEELLRCLRGASSVADRQPRGPAVLYDSMSNFQHNDFTTTRRRGRTWTWLTAALVLILVVVGTIFATGRWGENATRTGGGADVARVPPAAGPSQPGVPNAKPR
jgi:hypothetical protein